MRGEEEEPGEPAEVYETAKESNVLYCSTHLYEHFDENPDYDFFPGRGGEKPVIDGSKDAEALAKKAAGQPNNAVVDGDGKSCNSKEPVNCKKKEDVIVMVEAHGMLYKDKLTNDLVGQIKQAHLQRNVMVFKRF